MSCYIIKKPISGGYYTIMKNERKLLVAFTDRKQAHTYKRLMNEMDGHTKFKWTNNKLRVEEMSSSSIVRISNLSGLDVIMYSSDTNYLIYEADEAVTQDVRFNFEMKYRYYS